MPPQRTLNDVNWTSTPFTRLVDDINYGTHAAEPQMRVLPYLITAGRRGYQMLGERVEPNDSDRDIMVSIVQFLHHCTSKRWNCRPHGRDISGRLNFGSWDIGRRISADGLQDDLAIEWPATIEVHNGTGGQITAENRDRLFVGTIRVPRLPGISQPRAAHLRTVVDIINQFRAITANYEGGMK